MIILKPIHPAKDILIVSGSSHLKKLDWGGGPLAPPNTCFAMQLLLHICAFNVQPAGVPECDPAFELHRESYLY